MKKIKELTKCDVVFIFLPEVIAIIAGILLGVFSDGDVGGKIACISVSVLFFSVFGALAGLINYFIANTKLKKGFRVFLMLLDTVIWGALAAFLYVYFIILLIVSALRKV